MSQCANSNHAEGDRLMRTMSAPGGTGRATLNKAFAFLDPMPLIKSAMRDQAQTRVLPTCSAAAARKWLASV
jgi:hypothetical protein